MIYLRCKVLKESPGSALVKLGHGVPQHPEDDGLGGSEHQRQQPGQDHHPPEWNVSSGIRTTSLTRTIFLCLQGYKFMNRLILYHFTSKSLLIYIHAMPLISSPFVIERNKVIPGSLSLSYCVQTGQRIADADEPDEKSSYKVYWPFKIKILQKQI